jgi:hypothetical protein
VLCCKRAPVDVDLHIVHVKDTDHYSPFCLQIVLTFCQVDSESPLQTQPSLQPINQSITLSSLRLDTFLLSTKWSKAVFILQDLGSTRPTPSIRGSVSFSLTHSFLKSCSARRCIYSLRVTFAHDGDASDLSTYSATELRDYTGLQRLISPSFSGRSCKPGLPSASEIRTYLAEPNPVHLEPDLFYSSRDLLAHQWGWSTRGNVDTMGNRCTNPHQET